MRDSLGNRVALPGLQFYGFPFQFNDQPASEHEEELILFVMFMPMKVSFVENAEADHAVVNLAKSLIEPFLPGCVID
jgi:hypothetical protein